MQILIIIFLTIFISAPSFSQEVIVDWACPITGPKMPVKISYQNSKLTLNPNVIMFDLGGDLSCYNQFKHNFNVKLSRLHEEKCSSTSQGLCGLSVTQAEGLLKNSFNPPGLTSLQRLFSPPHPSSAESVLSQKVSSGEINLRNLNETFKYNRKDYKVSEFDKVIGDNIEKIFRGMSREEARQFTQNYMLAKSHILKPGPPSIERASVRENLEKMFGYIYGEKGEEELATALQCLPQEEAIRPLQAIFQQISTNNNRCRQLSPGQSMVFTKDPNDYYGTGDYTLRRKPDGHYQAILNINFKIGSGTVTPDAMMKRVRGCMSEASSAMKGPDGTRIELLALTPEETDKLPVNERPAPNQITIQGPNFDTDAASYAENVNCPVIIHEVLHLLGLCDEYKEDRPQNKDRNWDCRVITKAPSIMRDTADYGKAVGGTISCACNGDYCKSIMNSQDQSIIRLYMAQNFYDATENSFRASACTEEFISNVSIPEPSRSTVLLEQTENKLILESRFLSLTDSAPFFLLNRSRITCTCNPSDAACKNKLLEAAGAAKIQQQRKFCPAGSIYSGSETGQKVSSFDFNGSMIRFYSPPSIPSLLQPNHFYKILEGSCKGKSAPYQECAAHAYKSPNPTCTVPDKCRDDKYYLGSSQ